MRTDLFTSKLLRYGTPVVAVVMMTVVLWRLGEHINLTTVALVFLLVVLASATFFGRNPALLASFAAMLSFNYLFVPPVGTWHISDPQNLVAWTAFTITAIIAGELSAYARRRARESERLYEELQAAFTTATEAEALKQSEKMKSALLDAVTHDLRTPLTSIKASVTTLLDSEGGHRTIELDGPGRSEFLNIINEETDRLNRFVEGMVELARVEAGSTDAVDSTTNVDEAIATAIERAAAIANKHTTNVNIERDLPRVRADDRAVAEVIYNLYENAARYSPPGTEITIDARHVDGEVAISVNDQGRGIPLNMRERVFDKFFRVGDGAATGMGLGLAIVKGIVEAQNGRVEICDGNGGVGAKVVVTFSPKS